MQQDGIERERRPARAARTDELDDLTAGVEAAVEVVVERFKRGREALALTFTVFSVVVAISLTEELVPRGRDGAEVARDLIPEAVDSIWRKLSPRRNVRRKV